MPQAHFWSRFAAVVVLCGSAAFGQHTSPAIPSPPVLTASTRLVLVDVVVKDRAGNPVRNLPREAFHLTEDKGPQVIRSFEEVDAGPRSAPFAGLAKLPPGVYSDLQPRASGGAVNVLLIDALNTPTSDQTFLLDQLRRYLAAAPPGTPTAIFGLNTGLVLLQGFTGDPALLRSALERKSPKTPSHLLADPNGTNGAQPNLTDAMTEMANTMGNPAMVASMLAAVQQMEARTTAFQLQNRVQYTLDAFELLGHYLAGLPGRKNLIWFSGSFPLDILPDAENPNTDTFAPVQSNEDRFRDVLDLLTRAQVAVYPVDARSVRNAPVFDAAAASPQSRAHPANSMSSKVADFEHDQTSQEGSMKALATGTGGQAFHNTNDLAGAVAAAVSSGSHFYSLSYTPANTDWNRRFRSIRVELSPEAAHHGYTLAYRRGYYATPPDHKLHGSRLPTDEGAASRNLLAASMSHGAPTPSELFFKVQVRPVRGEPETTLAPGNRAGPDAPSGPLRRFSLDFVTLPQELELAEDEKGIRSGRLQLLAFVLSPDGRVQVDARKVYGLQLAPQTYVALRQNGLRVHLDLSAPATGRSFVRIGVRDMVSNKLGVVEFPLEEVSGLPPVAPADTPAAPQETGPAMPAADPGKASP